MTLIEIIEGVVSWLNEEVCGKIKLKVPNDEDSGDGYGYGLEGDVLSDAEYEPQYVHPAAFPLFVPGKELLPPSVPAPVPAVCVQLLEGEDSLIGHKRKVNVRLCLSCWNPGDHGDAIYGVQKAGPDLFSCYYRDGAAQAYARNMDGWRDSFNFLDVVLRELENKELISGLRVMKESGIKYGMFTEEGDVWNYYPYWHNWISFGLECGAGVRVPDAYKNFL